MDYNPANLVNRIKLYLIISIFFNDSYATEIIRPRGVPISKVSLYDPQKDFLCFDGTHSFPFIRVNDDYCDCWDGSDEPGTPACPNGTFHCTNAGHRPLNIPSSRVNDGICDCCDGSDEYMSKAKCVNNCSELGKAARIAAQRNAELRKAGNELRIQLSKKGKQLRLEKEEKLKQLVAEKEEAQVVKQEKDGIKREKEELEKQALEKYKKADDEINKKQATADKKVNEQEAFEYFHKVDTNQNGKLEKVELQSMMSFDQNKDGVVSEDELDFFIGGMSDDITWEEFLAQGWIRIKPFLMLQEGLFQPPSTEAPKEEEPQDNTPQDEDTDEGEDADDSQDGEPDEDDDEYEGEETTHTEEEKPEDSTPQYDEETQNYINEANSARSEYDDAENTLRDIQREYDQLRRTLDRDYGEDEEFASFEGECFEFTDSQYTYKFCPFDEVTQRPKSGGSDTRLGTWNDWIGQGDNKYREMLYDKGQSCWNGPQRSTIVKLTCGIENSLLSVTEPNRCEYLMEFVTPAACKVIEGEEHPSHDEL